MNRILLRSLAVNRIFQAVDDGPGVFDFASPIQAGFIPPDIPAFAFILPRTSVRGRKNPPSWASAQFLIFQLHRKTSTPISSQNAIYQNLDSLRLGDKKPLDNYES